MDFLNFASFTNVKNSDSDERDEGSPPPPMGSPSCDGSVTVRSRGVAVHCITIIGQIEGHYMLGSGTKTTKYEHLIPLLFAVDEDEKIGGVLIILNTQGGDVEAGLALSELIASMRKPTASLVIGGGHSIGVPLAVSADRSFIVPSATMTLHPVRINGLVLGAQQAYDYLNKMQERIIRFISEHSGVSAEKLREFMFKTDEIATDLGTVLNGYEAVEVGLIDEIGGIARACDWLTEQARKAEVDKNQGK
ncbi:MAG: ClpP family protease [Eubacteriales bacterium]|jgi:ATP-dependent protease ClpP protease subunit|nr:translocation-enhancing protein TepA [Clostridiales bacterium]